MNNIDTHIYNINKAICDNIDKFNKSERGLLSQNIISHLRKDQIDRLSKSYNGSGVKDKF